MKYTYQETKVVDVVETPSSIYGEEYKSAIVNRLTKENMRIVDFRPPVVGDKFLSARAGWVENLISNYWPAKFGRARFIIEPIPPTPPAPEFPEWE